MEPVALDSAPLSALTPEPAPLPSPPPLFAAERVPRRWYVGLFVALVMSQAFMGFMGAGDRFVVGHNGWNSSAYLQSARNTIRWGTLFPVQYYTGRTPPQVGDGYTHHPLGMHLHNTLAVLLFGDSEATIRSVPAFFGVLALIALMSVVRLLYDRRTALIAGAIWVLLPTNAIFTNMSNHENGFIFWTFLWGYAYFKLARARLPSVAPQPANLASAAGDARGTTAAAAKWKRWYAFLLGGFFWAAMWDWPAYYCALIVALHWFILVIGKFRRGDRKLRAILPDVALLAGFSALVVGLFIGHFLLVTAVVGSLSELQGVFEARQVVSHAMIVNHLKVVPLLMFTAPVLLVAFGWFFHRLWQAVKGKLARRDLIALTFGIAGLLHYYIFRGTAVIHEFWGWTLTPFTAIACAYVLGVAIDKARAYLTGRWPRWRRLMIGVAIAVPSLAIAGNLAWRFVDLVPRGRAVGGSLWFIEHTRPVQETYVSNREMVRFAHEVKQETTRRVGVILDPSFTAIFGYEPRVPITLDREVVEQTLKSPPPERLGVTEGWVYLVPRASLSERRLTELALMHPIMIYDSFVMVDLRRDVSEVRVYASEETDRDLWTWYWGGPWADAVEPVEQPDEEARLTKQLADYRAARPR